MPLLRRPPRSRTGTRSRRTPRVAAAAAPPWAGCAAPSGGRRRRAPAGDGAEGAAGERRESGGRERDGGGERERHREPLSVLEILELIQRRHLVAADAQIIALEAECSLSPSRPPSPGPLRRPGARRRPRARDVALLYRALLSQLWAVVAESVASPPPAALAPLRAVVAVLEQEEAADARCPPGARPGRPRALRRRWHEAVARAAGERLAQVAPAGGLGARLAALAARVVGDLGVVRGRVAPEYPPEWGATGVYARGYHRALGQQVTALAQRPLDVAEMYLLLDWHSNAYPRPRWRWPWRQELQLSEDRWPEDVTSQDMEDGLATRVTGCHHRAPVTPPSPSSFQRKVERFLDAPGEAPPPEATPGRAIALANCCPPLRAFAERLAQFGHAESEGPRRQAHAALDRVTRACGHLLTRRLFEELKPHFGKLMKRKWLTSSDAFDAIVMLVTGFAQTLRPLHPEPHQVLVSELHRRVLIEYVRPLLQGRLVCASAKARARVAARLGDEARQLRELFTRLDSASPWLDSVVPRLRELLVLEDTAALQMEVGALARDFPDVRRRHVAALLDARGLRAQGPRREILGVLQDLGGGSEPEPGPAPPRCRAFFAELAAPRPVRCLPFQLRLPRLPRRGPARPPPCSEEEEEEPREGDKVTPGGDKGDTEVTERHLERVEATPGGDKGDTEATKRRLSPFTTRGARGSSGGPRRTKPGGGRAGRG
ncbi:LOW QUALITY PROTEIN: tumor necrosis factor alpha-induced protein 2-like [Melospiza melodia melodia]|uniref:LOW QUALITY PROTEIN: tumor necrosis factor alpha-induced protein 2-like n=1 Tax=Melospiza melodia melodia TaxID=1914991 RepID=UPI002FD21AE0